MSGIHLWLQINASKKSSRDHGLFLLPKRKAACVTIMKEKNKQTEKNHKVKTLLKANRAVELGDLIWAEK